MHTQSYHDPGRASALVAQANIGEVWDALGGPKLRHGRGPAWWRGGDGLNVALDDDRGVWYDFSRSEGGGMLNLVCAVLGCDRRNALRWLATYLGVDIDHVLTTAERRVYAARRRRAEVLAGELTEWRARLLFDLRQRRNAYWDRERRASRWARDHIDDPVLADSWTWDAVWAYALDGARGDAIDREIQGIEAMTPTELHRLRSGLERAA